MTARPTLDDEERRRRIGARQQLHERAAREALGDVADRLVGVHASDPASVYLGLWARVDGLTREDLAAALYDQRTLVKILGMRRTMFVAPVALAGVMQAAVTADLAAAQRRRLLGMLADAGIAADPARWLRSVEDETVAALDDLGEATAAQLAKRVAGLREQITFGSGKCWQGRVGVSTRLLFLLATEGRIIRGRPMGSWLSSLYRWALMERWIEGGLEVWPPERARAELARRWLATYGPGSQRDLQWWTGWTVARTRAALRDTGAIEVGLADGSTGFVLDDDAGTTPALHPWVALLPALDTTTMAWNGRGFYLGDFGPALFDRNGNAGPTVWSDGRIVGGWGQQPSGDIATRLLVDVGRAAQQAIEAEAAAIQAWLGPDRIVPRFRTPTEQELAAG